MARVGGEILLLFLNRGETKGRDIEDPPQDKQYD